MATVTKKKEVIDLDAVLGGATKPTGKKDETPSLSIPPEYQELAHRLREIKAQMESLEGEFKAKEKDLLDIVEPMYAKLCKQGVISTVKIPDGHGESIKINWKEAYKKIPMNQKPKLEAIVGEDKYEQYFRVLLEIKVVPNISEEMLTELVKAVGVERFAEFFTVKRDIAPTSLYHSDFFSLFTDSQRIALEKIVEQYKPAILTK